MVGALTVKLAVILRATVKNLDEIKNTVTAAYVLACTSILFLECTCTPTLGLPPTIDNYTQLFRIDMNLIHKTMTLQTLILLIITYT